MRQKKAFTSSDLIVRFVAPAFWRFFITFSSLFGELSYNIKYVETDISTHTPLARRDNAPVRIRPQTRISTHTPLARRDTIREMRI